MLVPENRAHGQTMQVLCSEDNKRPKYRTLTHRLSMVTLRV